MSAPVSAIFITCRCNNWLTDHFVIQLLPIVNLAEWDRHLDNNGHVMIKYGIKRKLVTKGSTAMKDGDSYNIKHAIMDFLQVICHLTYWSRKIRSVKRTCSTVPATSFVSVVVIVWILIGCSLPMATFPTITVQVFLRTVLCIFSQYFCLGTRNNKSKPRN